MTVAIGSAVVLSRRPTESDVESLAEERFSLGVAAGGARDGERRIPLCANVAGVGLHAGDAVPAHDRQRPERLVRSAARPPLGNERLAAREDERLAAREDERLAAREDERLAAREDGRLVHRLRRRWRDGGKLREAAHGLFYAPIESRFGAAAAREDEILRAFFGASPFVVTGPPRWNALGLGSTAMFAATVVYNTRRTGDFTFDGRRFLLRRVLFPESPPPEWFVVDLLQHHEMAGASLTELEERLVATLRDGRWNRKRLRELAGAYGTKATLALVERCLDASRPVS